MHAFIPICQKDMLLPHVTDKFWAQNVNAKEGTVGCGPNLPSDICSAQSSCSVPALQCHMSIYILYSASIGTCVANAWGAGMEFRKAWGLLTSFMIFRLSLYFPHASSYLPKASKSQNQQLCLPPNLSLACFKSLYKVEMYFIEITERILWFSIFYMGPPLPEGAREALAVSQTCNPSLTSFPCLYPMKGLPLLSTGLFAAVFRSRALMTTN